MKPGPTRILICNGCIHHTTIEEKQSIVIEDKEVSQILKHNACAHPIIIKTYGEAQSMGRVDGQCLTPKHLCPYLFTT